jgi:PEP-CTERM motif-containing protein
MSNETTSRLTRRFIFPLIFAAMTLMAFAHKAKANEVAVWNFNDADLIVDHGNGTLTTNLLAANVGFAGGTTNNSRLGDVAGQALQLQGGTSNANNGRNLTFNISTLGFENIIVSFATQGTSTGFNSNQLQYSLDGVTFIDFGSPYTPTTAFGSTPVIFNLGAILGLNDNPNAAFRIVFNGATSSTGNNRIDNFVVEGSALTSPIPEPTTVLLLGTGITGIVSLRNKRKGAASK